MGRKSTECSITLSVPDELYQLTDDDEISQVEQPMLLTRCTVRLCTTEAADFMQALEPYMKTAITENTHPRRSPSPCCQIFNIGSHVF